MNKDLSSIFETTSSFYHSASGRWLNGKVLLSSTYIEFVEGDKDSEDDDIYRISILLSNISSIEKKQSSLIYPSIVIMVKSTTYWFSSFPNRDSVFHLLELFWREHLLFRRRELRFFSSGLLSSFGQTKLGSELLGLLSESEKNLAIAGVSLERQGHQLKAAEDSVEMIHGDLSVAENLMSAMSMRPSSSSSRTTESVAAPAKEKTSCEMWNVVFAPEASEDKVVWYPGSIQFKNNELCVLDNKNQVKHGYKHDDVMSVQVVSPWQLRIYEKDSVNSNGCDIMCPGLSKALSKFIEVYKDKMSFTEAYPSCPLPNSHSSSEGWQLIDQQLLQSTSSISSDEINELSTLITNLRGLASEIGREQHAQMERIDNLIMAVDKADLRMKTDVGVMKKKI